MRRLAITGVGNGLSRALGLLFAIVLAGLFLPDDYGYIRWATTGGKGIGRTTRGALIGARDAEHARARARAHYEATKLAAGNGTVMRATPIGLAAHDLDFHFNSVNRGIRCVDDGALKRLDLGLKLCKS